MKYLDPRNDMAFKKIFGEHKHLCISLLNALMPFKEDEKIVSLEYKGAEMLAHMPLSKNSIVDVRCVDMKGRHFIVEMQMYWSNGFMHRTLYNAAKEYSMQLDQQSKFTELQPVYTLCLLNDTYADVDIVKDEFIHPYNLQHSKHPELTIEGLHFVFVEMPKFSTENKAYNKMANLWLEFMTKVKGLQEDDVPQAWKDEPLISEALNCLKVSSFSEEEMIVYDKIRNEIMSQVTSIDDALREGESRKAIEIARNLKSIGLTNEQISQSTGLNVSIIAGL